MTNSIRGHARLPEGSVWTGPELLFDDRIGATDLKVFLGLCSYANVATDSTYVSQTTLADKLNMSRKTVNTSLQKLEELGYIETESRCKSNGKGRTTNLYRIVNKYPEQVEEEEVQPEPEPQPEPQKETKPSNTSNQQTLFNLPNETPYSNLSTMKEGREKSVMKIDGALGGHIPYETITTLDVCYYYQHLHKEIVGYNVSVNRTMTQAQGRKTSMDYMEQFMARFGLTIQTAISTIPRLLTEFRRLCEAEGRKRAEWCFHIGVLTWTGASADVEKIMSRIQPKVNDKYLQQQDTPAAAPERQSSGIVF